MQIDQNGQNDGQFPFDARFGAGRDPVLDGLRAIAVLAVVIGHAINFRWADHVHSYVLEHAAGAASEIGVQIFFLISGFVITRLLISERRKNGKVDVGGFYIRRICRIFPPLAAYILTVAVLSYMGYIDVTGTAILAGGSFVCNLGITSCTWFVGHTWTLSVEEQFYLIWPTIFILTPSRYRIHVLSAGVAGLVAMSLIRGYRFNSNEIAFSYIAIGCLFASSRHLQQFVVERIGTLAWLGALVVLAAAIGGLPHFVQMLVKPLALPFVVFGAANINPVRKLLSLPVVQAVGLSSYSTYLWQELFLAHPSEYGGMPLPVLLLPVVVALSWMLIEKPSIRLGRMMSRRQARVTEVHAG